MEFEQYLERDILTFLDSKIYKKENTSVDREEEYGLYLTKDYLKELNYALDNDELTRAKKLFDELKVNYSRLPKSSVERKKIYSLLEKMYEKIQNYVRIKEGKIEIIKQGDIEVFKDTTEKFSSIADRMEKAAILPQLLPLDIMKPEPTKRTELPIRSSTNRELESPKKSPSQDDTLLFEKKSNLKNDFSTESNRLEKTTTDQSEKSKINESELTRKGLEKDFDEDSSKKNKPKVSKSYVEEHVFNQAVEQARNRELKNEIIDKTAAHLEKLKIHVTDRLLEELRKKLDENSDEQSKKIESLRKDIVEQVIEELDKRLKKEKSDVSKKIDSLRKEILDEVYHQAQQLISLRDNQNAIIEEQYTLRRSINNHNALSNSQSKESTTEFIDRNGAVKLEKDESLDEFKDEVKTNQTSIETYSGEELRVVYEQAIYYMFDNKYDEAAKLFKKIITVQPNNKSAYIRLQECFEKQPELHKDEETISDSEFKTIIKPSNTTKKTYAELYDSNKLTETNAEIMQYDDNLADKYKNTIDEHVDTHTKRAHKLQKNNIRGKYNDEELQKMYEEAVYTMFQNKHNEAAEMFQQILRIRPDDKAAHIRLYECFERQPELHKDEETLSDSEFKTIIKSSNTTKTEQTVLEENATKTTYSESDDANKLTETNAEIEENISEDNNDFETEVTEQSYDFLKDIKRLTKSDTKHRYKDEKLQKMYEEAIYTMFQNNYDEAAEIFQQILRIQPENKAARIRLQECREASGNA
jgi:tetratricopeptide (TPR) repeat protein